MLTYSLGPFPLSLSTEMSTLHKPRKVNEAIELGVQDHAIDNNSERNAIIPAGWRTYSGYKEATLRIHCAVIFQGDNVVNSSQIFVC